MCCLIELSDDHHASINSSVGLAGVVSLSAGSRVFPHLSRWCHQCNWRSDDLPASFPYALTARRSHASCAWRIGGGGLRPDHLRLAAEPVAVEPVSIAPTTIRPPSLPPPSQDSPIRRPPFAGQLWRVASFHGGASDNAGHANAAQRTALQGGNAAVHHGTPAVGKNDRFVCVDPFDHHHGTGGHRHLERCDVQSMHFWVCMHECLLRQHGHASVCCLFL